MQTLKRILMALAVLLLCGLGTCASYYLPSTEKVQITGTEVRRFDQKKPTDLLRDVRYIQARRIADDEVLVFRNEDTRWGWPPYFKFDSADLSAQASNIEATTKDATVLVTYYGVRSKVFDLYPNATSLKVVDAQYTHVPVFNIAFSVVSVALLVAAFVYLRRAVEWVVKKLKREPTAAK